ncbi:MAG: ATP-binding protein [Candidatus Levyibacteriota bacterium]|nr:MAG: ATP-binding protein [Candidatus Levybacteria bacterium]
MNLTEIELLLKKWNPHFENPEKGEWVGTVPREKYLKRLWKAMDIRHILILTGVRRSGKSTLMRQLMGKLIETGTNPKNVLYLYFEDLLVQPYLSSGAKILEQFYTFYLEKHNPQGKVYIFLDELQGIREFNHWLHTHYEFNKNVKFIISGSRRSLIDSETATVLTGRNVQFDIYPFNFYEYLQVKNIEVRGENTVQSIIDDNFSQTNSILHHLGNFFLEGGYPEIVLARDKENKTSIANAYYRDILARDVTGPNNIRNSREIEVLGLQILSDFTKTHTYRSLGKPQGLSVDTIKTYLDYFYNSYLFFESKHFSYKTKETQDIRRPIKIYVVDNGLRNFNTLNVRPDWGQCAENMTYMELKKNNVSVSYWQGKKEIDFVILNPTISLLNVSYTDDMHHREIEGLVEGLKEFKIEEGTILTKNYSSTKEMEGKKLLFVPLWAWLILNGKVFFKET